MANTKNNSKKNNNNIKIKANNNTKKKTTTNNKNNSKNITNSNSNTKINNSKKSNYNKIQDKVLENKKTEKEKDNRKKEVKQKKQVVRKEKKIQIAKDRTLKRKVVLLLLSIVIKIKYLFVKLYHCLKNSLIFIIICIKKFGIFLKNSFLNFLSKIKNHKGNKKNKKEKKEKKVKEKKKEKKERNKKILIEEKKEKDAVLKKKVKIKLLRSLTGRIFPTTFLKGDKKRRKTIYLKEALILAIFITIIDFIGFYNSNYFDMLHIFDNSLLNLVATITLTLLIVFIGAYLIDLMVTEIFLKIRKKKGRRSK